MITMQEIENDLVEFEKTPKSYGLDLRLDLADIIRRHLLENGVTAAQLAQRSNTTEKLIVRLVNGNDNCTFDTAGKILHAMGIRASLTQK